MLAGGSIRYSVPAPFERAVESICTSLRNRGMRLAGQLDVSGRLQGSLGIALAPCKVLFVLPCPATSSIGAVHPWAAAFLPLHVVISSIEGRSEIHIPNKVQSGRTVPASVMEAQRQLFEAVEAVATRSSVLS